MSCPETVKKLVETFRCNIDYYKSIRYKEAQLRKEFLDPFFKELGWDMDNTAGLAPQYRDVIHEASLKIGGSTKAPDYAFTIHGQYKFFLEAKTPAINVRQDTEPSYQLRRYGWSAKLPVSILTDFEEFAIYDCRKRPKRGERASTSRLGYFKYTDYIEKWDELCDTFSKDAILKGSFDRYTVTARRHRGTETVDAAFLGEIEKWRNLLARNFALRNATLSVRDLNYAVQKTIDRIIFLRICEDRGTENYMQLASLLNDEQIYSHLLEQFMLADARYNSGLFHFSTEGGRGAPDKVTPNLTLDDKILREIFSKLYYPESPYEFSVISVDILGQVYEQFLGKTIRLTTGHQAKIEEKPEVRKAGGVYYTPSYIVDYIVKKTLGRQLDGSNSEKPKPISLTKATKIKVLDPACGSGSFLIVAYQYLLDWHLRQYTADPKTSEPDEGKIKRHAGGKKPKIYQAPGGAWKLTTDERKRILLDNIFGVDIDSQAVEVTKLSLLLKVIEGEAQQIKQRNWIHERQRILPDIGNNIKCGNSLIGTDFYDNEQMLLLEEEDQYHINVFDWYQGFPEIMQRGGFDCVIGNPPYVVLTSGDAHKATLDYLDNYQVAQYKRDLYHLFFEKGLSLVIDGGMLGYITPNTWLTLQYNDKLREHVLAQSNLDELVVFDHLVFSGANVYTCLTILSANKPKNNLCSIRLPQSARSCTSIIETVAFDVPQNKWLASEGHVIETRQHSPGGRLAAKIMIQYLPLSSQARASLGCQAYNSSKHTKQQIKNRIFHSETKLSNEYLPELSGRDVGRYALQRIKGKWIRYGAWLHDYRPLEMLSGPRVLLREIPGKPPYAIKAAYLEDTYCHYKTILNVNPPIGGSPLSMKYLCGLLNSRLLSFIFPYISNKIVTQAFPRLSVGDLKKLPIRPIDFDNPDDYMKHDKMVGLVERMLNLNAKKGEENNPDILQQIEMQLAATDRQIDSLVYDLYGLSNTEIELVEQTHPPDGTTRRS